MFDLDQEVSHWLTTVHAATCQPSGNVAELRDHLYCEIEEARASGQSEEAAFHAAVARMGAAQLLSSEHQKNRSALGTICQVAAKIDRFGSLPENRPLLLAHAVIWAALIMGSSVVMSKSAEPAISGWLLTGVFIPLWWISEQLLRAAMRQRAAR